jgi:uncharacterized metal-binding protein
MNRFALAHYPLAASRAGRSKDLRLLRAVSEAEAINSYDCELTYKEYNDWKFLQGISLVLSCFIAHRRNSQHLFSGVVTHSLSAITILGLLEF